MYASFFFLAWDKILKLWWIQSFPYGSSECAVVHAAAYETRGTSHVFSTCCGLELTAGRTESCSGVMLPSLLLLLLSVLVALATSVLCVSDSVLFLALFLPYPIQQSVDQVTVLCALPLPQLHHHTPQPLTHLLKPLNPSTHTGTRTEAVGLLSRPTCSGTTWKWLMLLVWNQWS